MRGAQKGRELGGEKERDIGNKLRAMSASIRQLQTAACLPKFALTPTFIFCSPIFPYNCGAGF